MLHLEVELRPEADHVLESLLSGPQMYRDDPDPVRPPLFALRRPADGFSADVVRLLMFPIAGHEEPLGRRPPPRCGRDERGYRRRPGDWWPASAPQVVVARPAPLEATLIPTVTDSDDESVRVRVTDDTGTTIVDGRAWIDWGPADVVSLTATRPPHE